MRVLTEEEVIAFFKTIDNDNFNSIEIFIMLKSRLQEIDTLTVSKLRPMCDASKDVSGFIAIQGNNELYPAYFMDGRAYVCDRFVMFDECDGWIPMPIYKPEITGE